MTRAALNRCLLWSAVFIFSVFFWGCRENSGAEAEKTPAQPSATASAPAAPPAADQGAPVPSDLPLEVLRFGPSGEVKQLSQVVAMFNQPMAALGDYRNVPDGAMTIEPPTVEGDFMWLNQYTLAFVPRKPITGSLDLKASLNPSALAALSGAKLDSGLAIDISLPVMAVTNAYQVNSPPLDEDQALRPVWRLYFNQEPDLADLAAKTAFQYDGGKSVPVTAEKVEGGWSNLAFDVTAKERLPKNVKYSLVVAEGLKSLAGPKPGPRLIAAEGATYGPLTVGLDSGDEPVDPQFGLHLTFSNPVRLSEVAPRINIDNGFDVESFRKTFLGTESAEVPDEESPAAEDEYESIDDIQSYLFISGAFLADAEYTLTVDAGIRDIFGQTMDRPFSVKFKTGQYDTYLRLGDEYGLLETALEPKLRLVASNIGEARITGYALTAEQAIRFLSASGYSPDYYGNIEDANHTLAGIKPHRMTLEIPNGAKNGRVILPLDLAGLFEGRIKGNLLFVKSSWKETSGKETHERSTFALTQISDIGLAVKVGPAASLIWTTDLVKGQSWGGVELELRDSEARLLWSGESDEDGLARLPGTTEIMSKLDGDDSGLFVVAKAGEQMALWNVNWNDGLENWRWNVQYEDALSRGRGGDHWLLNALPLYKPGETAKFKIIARENSGDSLRDLTGEKLELEIHDAQGRLIERASVEIGPFGTAVHELPIAADASLGYWSVSAAHSGEEGPSYIGSFMVMNYRPPAFEIKIEGLPEDVTAGGAADLTVKADYHFGAPVAGQPVKYSVTSNPDYFSLPGEFSGYSIVNRFSQADEYDDSGYGYSEPSVTVASGETTLDRDGRLALTVDLKPAPDQKPFPRTYATFVTVTDVDQRQVSTSGRFLVHPASLYAGLSGESFVAETGQPFTMKVIAADHQGRLMPDQKITATLYRRVWQNVRRKSAGTAYEYVSRMVDEKMSVQELTSGALPTEMTLIPEKPGYYWVLAEIKDDQGRLNQAACDFYASGGGPVGWRMGNDDSLTLVTDKTEYRPGDVAKIMVQSPFDRGEGLLTVERAGVRSSKVFSIENQTPVLEVPLGEDDAPNVFVSVLLTRGRIADKAVERGLDLGKPAIRLGYVELKIPTKKDLLTVEVAPDKAEVGPGGEVEIVVSVKDNQGRPFSEAEVTLIAADAAVIQLGGDQAYHPERQFHRDQPLMVQTADNLISLIGRHDWGLKGANPGGGGGELSGAGLDGDGVRRLFSALAWFEPRVKLDDQGRAKVKIKMPENLTTFKVYAVATGHGRKTGTGQSSVLVTRDLLVRSALPGYAGVGDEFEAAMVVSNRGQGQGEATVKLSGHNFTLLDGRAEKTVAVGPGESHEVSFRVKAGSEAEAKFLFEVSMGQDRDRVEFAIPVSPPNQLTTQASYERLEPGEFRTDLALAEGLDLNRGGVELELSPSLLGVMSEPFDWLAAYPHGCIEQQTSKSYAALLRLRLKNRFGEDEKQEAQARAAVAEMLRRLGGWDQSGGYNFWPDSYDWSNRSVYLSAYVLDFILSADEDGFKPPDPELTGRIVGFLKSALSGEDYRWPEWYSDRAVREAKSYALAMLSRAGENVAAYIEVMDKDRQNLSLFELINLIRAVNFQPKGHGQAGRIRELLPLLTNHIQVTAGEVKFAEARTSPPEIWSSPIRTSAMALTALCEAAPHNDLIPSLARALVAAGRAGHFGTTQNNVAALAALAAYTQVMEPTAPDLGVTALLGDDTLARAEFKSFRDRPVRGEAPLTSVPAENPAVVYNTTGSGQAWAALKIKTAPAEPDLSAATSGGFMLSRAFTVVAPRAGSPGADSFKRGDVVRVSVTMMVPAYRNSLVLEDRVPAGFEPINFNLADADRTLLALAGEGDDNFRYRFWYNHQEIRPDRVTVYADRLAAGVYTFSYLARAITPGVYLTPGPQAEEMYAPETFGRGEGQKLKVE